MIVAPRPGSGYINRGRGGAGPYRGRGRGGRRGGFGRGEPINNAPLPNQQNDEPPENTDPQEYYAGPPRPNRPLTRVLARTRVNSQNKDAPPEDNFDNAYVMEVNDYSQRTTSNTLIHIPVVTVKDMRNFVPDKRQRRAVIPVGLAEDLYKCLKKCRQEADKGPYDISKISPQTFQCPATKRKVEIEHVTEANGKVSTRVRTSVDTLEKSQSNDDEVTEVFELRNELMGHLVKFLEDVATRYCHLEGDIAIPSLYSYSGERRYFYDLRETRWGTRLQVSQVTGMYRNVIGIPLESVVAFRDRINQAINFLGLEKKPVPGAVAVANGQTVQSNRQRTVSEGSSRRGGGRGRGRGRGRRYPRKQVANGQPGEGAAVEPTALPDNTVQTSTA